MKRLVPVLLGLLTLSFLVPTPGFAQDKVAVTLKVFPPEYELFFQGDRLPYSPKGEGLRTYQLPLGTNRVNLTAPASAPLSLSLEVKAGMAVVQAKLEPRLGPLDLVGEAATGKLPRSVAFAKDGKLLFVALQGEPGIEVFDIPSLKKRERMIPSEPGTTGFSDVMTLGNEVWAVQKDGRVHIFDGTTLAFKESKALAGSGNTYLTDLGGGKVALANWDNLQLLAVDAALRTPSGRISTGGSLRGFAFGQGVGYATLFDKGQIAVIDVATWKVRTTWNAGKAPRPLAVVGSTLFVGDMGSAQVLLLDAAGKTTKTVSVPSNPHAMAVSLNQTRIAVASRGRNNTTDYQLPGPDFGKVTILDAQGRILGSVWGRNQPTGLAFSPDGKYLAFTDFLDNNLELYRVVQ